MIRVLIVDDDKLARTGLRMSIPWEKYDMHVVAEASNGKKALEIMESTKVDLAFIDISMPVMGGIEMMEQASRRFPKTKFAVLSFHEEFNIVQDSIRLGVIDYISKEQTETENFDKVMENIHNKFLKETREDPEDKKQLNAFQNLFQDELWLYDSMRMREIGNELNSNIINLRSLERVLFKVMFSVTAKTGIELPPVPVLYKKDEVMQYLYSVRNHFRENILIANQSIYKSMMEAVVFVESSDVHITAEDVAEKISFSRSYFATTFKKLFGITYRDFVRRACMDKACQLMIDEDLSYEEAASRVGYLDMRNFSNTFQEIVGCKPSDYKKQRISACVD